MRVRLLVAAGSALILSLALTGCATLGPLGELPDGHCVRIYDVSSPETPIVDTCPR